MENNQPINQVHTARLSLFSGVSHESCMCSFVWNIYALQEFGSKMFKLNDNDHVHPFVTSKISFPCYRRSLLYGCDICLYYRLQQYSPLIAVFLFIHELAFLASAYFFRLLRETARVQKHVHRTRQVAQRRPVSDFTPARSPFGNTELVTLH